MSTQAQEQNAIPASLDATRSAPPPQGFHGKTHDEMWSMAQAIAKSQFAPKDMRGKPHDVYCAIKLGAELGVSEMQAVQNIAVINSRPAVWGDMMLAICMRHHALFDQEAFCEWHEGTEGKDTWTGVCRCKRKGQGTPIERRFSMADARKAGLLNRKTVWDTMPKRMLQMRARAFALRDCFPDVLKGLYTREEMAVDQVLDGLDLTGSLETQLKRETPTKNNGETAATGALGPEESLPPAPVISGDAPTPETQATPAPPPSPEETEDERERQLLVKAVQGNFDKLTAAAQNGIRAKFPFTLIADIATWPIDDLRDLREAIHDELQPTRQSSE